MAALQMVFAGNGVNRFFVNLCPALIASGTAQRQGCEKEYRKKPHRIRIARQS